MADSIAPPDPAESVVTEAPEAEDLSPKESDKQQHWYIDAVGKGTLPINTGWKLMNLDVPDISGNMSGAALPLSLFHLREML